jgi:predicted  nucleic acid-binding Zn-ribbon protein
LLKPDVLERAQKAESQVAMLSGNQKELEQTTKRSLAEMTSQLAEAQRREAKAESESSALRGGFGSMKDAWAREVKSLRVEVKKTEERWKSEHDQVRAKNQALLKLVQDQS